MNDTRPTYPFSSNHQLLSGVLSIDSKNTIKYCYRVINRYVVVHLFIDGLELRKKKIAIADDGCTLMVTVSGYCEGKLMFY